MQPLTINNPELIDGHWLSQGVLVVGVISGLYLWSIPWGLSPFILFIPMYLNQQKINRGQFLSLKVNTQWQWFVIKDGQVISCQLISHWHVGQFLWIRLDSEVDKHYWLIRQSVLGESRYAHVLMAINQNEQ